MSMQVRNPLQFRRFLRSLHHFCFLTQRTGLCSKSRSAEGKAFLLVPWEWKVKGAAFTDINSPKKVIAWRETLFPFAQRLF
ncbi:hypothetical protein TNCT_387381 [Trichonephila clavata]|uniref:Uncharacterized protein n=1 Tax=Trichonephila clavata TaxID=2740835 RepID=A0A8X6KZU3_TRICU|nr:hypothetical protein TNCT_387381 [Trichonephila clavata]